MLKKSGANYVQFLRNPRDLVAAWEALSSACVPPLCGLSFCQISVMTQLYNM